MARNKALFLDRDGVINIDRGYVHRAEETVYVDGVLQLIGKANSLRYLTIVVTNQAGIARGYYTEHQFFDYMNWLCADLARQSARIDKYYFSPCHPTEGIGIYRREDYMRKPNSGMFIAARDEFDVDMSQSIMIGDKLSDLQASYAAGVGTNFLLGSNLTQHDVAFPLQCIRDLTEVMMFLKK